MAAQRTFRKRLRKKADPQGLLDMRGAAEDVPSVRSAPDMDNATRAEPFEEGWVPLKKKKRKRKEPVGPLQLSYAKSASKQLRNA